MKYILALFFLLIIIQTNAQNKADKLKVFLDCSNYNGNYSFDYVRQEMNLITFVRDRMDADAHILAKSNRNSAGTWISTFFIMGKNQYANIQDKLTYDVSANCTEDDARKLFVRNLQIALLPFIAHTTLVNKINISFKNENDEIVDTVTKDPYRNWVFQIGPMAIFLERKYFGMHLSMVIFRQIKKPILPERIPMSTSTSNIANTMTMAIFTNTIFKITPSV